MRDYNSIFEIDLKHLGFDYRGTVSQQLEYMDEHRIISSTRTHVLNISHGKDAFELSIFAYKCDDGNFYFNAVAPGYPNHGIEPVATEITWFNLFSERVATMIKDKYHHVLLERFGEDGFCFSSIFSQLSYMKRDIDAIRKLSMRQLALKVMMRAKRDVTSYAKSFFNIYADKLILITPAKIKADPIFYMTYEYESQNDCRIFGSILDYFVFWMKVYANTMLG